MPRHNDSRDGVAEAIPNPTDQTSRVTSLACPASLLEWETASLAGVELTTTVSPPGTQQNFAVEVVVKQKDGREDTHFANGWVEVPKLNRAYTKIAK